MSLEVFCRAQHKLVAQLTRVLHHKADRLALLGADVGGRKAHGVAHVHLDGAGHLASDTGFTDDWRIMPAAVTAGCKSACGARQYCASSDEFDSIFQEISLVAGLLGCWVDGLVN
jgi:hypothetical protein